MTTELVAQLRLVRPKAKYEFAKDHFLMIGKVMREAADELERLERERAEWAGIAAQRNRTNALLADDRDTERTKRLQAQHERDCAVEKLAELREQFIQVADVMEKDGRFPTTVKAIRATVDVPSRTDKLRAALADTGVKVTVLGTDDVSGSNSTNEVTK